MAGHEFGHGAWGGMGGPVVAQREALGKPPPPPFLVGLPPAPPPPPARVVIVCALKDGVEALNNIRAHGTQRNPQAACIRHGLGDILLQIEEVISLARLLATMCTVGCGCGSPMFPHSPSYGRSPCSGGGPPPHGPMCAGSPRWPMPLQPCPTPHCKLSPPRARWTHR